MNSTSSMSTTNSSGCLTAFVAAFSRILLLMFWISRPVAWETTFQTAIWPCLGFLFLPFTTLMYAWLMQGQGLNGQIQGIDWLWLILAIVIDVANLGTAGYANRNRVPGYGTDTVTPPPPSSPTSAS